MRRACIDIGSNTTRLLIADCEQGVLRPVHQERAFTRIAPALAEHRAIPADKLTEIVEAACAQLARARELGALEVRAVGTEALRRASNREQLLSSVRAACGLEISVLSGEEEGRLAFLGAASMLEGSIEGTFAVADVGGGSSELVVGTAPDEVAWCVSLPLGSGALAQRFLGSDPPLPSEVEEARADVDRVFARVRAPQVGSALAVGGSAASLLQLAGPVLDAESCDRALERLTATDAQQLADELALEPQRVRLLPAGLLILRAAAKSVGCALRIGRGGLREGVLLADQSAFQR